MSSRSRPFVRYVRFDIANTAATHNGSIQGSEKVELVVHRLCQCGLLLFVFGLLLGFALPVFPNRTIALGAHETAIQGGTFLIAMSLTWPRLRLTQRWSSIAANSLWISFFSIEAGLTVAAASSKSSAAQAIVMTLNIGGAVLMLATALGLLAALRKPSQGRSFGAGSGR